MIIFKSSYRVKAMKKTSMFKAVKNCAFVGFMLVHPGYNELSIGIAIT